MTQQNRADRRRTATRNRLAAKGDGPFETMGLLERIELLNLLPREGNAITLKVLRDLNDELGLTEAELKKAKVVTDGPRLQWDVKAALTMDKDITVGPKALEIIKDALNTLETKGKLGLSHLGLYERFVEGVVPEKPSTNGRVEEE